MVSELGWTGHHISKIEMKSALLRGLTKELDIIQKSITSIGLSYDETVPKDILRETR